MFHRLGLQMVRWRYWIVGIWALAVLIGLPFAPRVAEVLAPGGFSSNSMESQQAINALQKGLSTSFTSVQVVFSSTTMTADDPRFVAEAQVAVANLSDWSEVAGVVPFSVNPTQISRDRRAAYTVVLLKSDPDSAPGILPELRQRLRRPADLQMLVGGAPVFYADIQSVSEGDLRRAEEIAFPFAIIALLLVFRSVIAAGLPAAIGGCSVVVSLALLYLLARVFPVSIFALNITTLFGLGLGVDYSLFMVSRFREELKSGHTVTDAVGIAMSTAGRAVFFSGLAVSIGLLGLVFFPLNMLRSVGIGGMLTVILSILAAVTLLPALLGIIGTRVNALPVVLPWSHSRRDSVTTDAQERPGFWHQLATAVMRHPLAFLIPVLTILLLLGAPFLSVRLAAPDASILPTRVDSRRAYDALTQRFDQSASAPIIIAVKTEGSPLTTANLILLDKYVRELQADPRVQSVISIVSLDPHLTLEQYQLMYSQPQNISDPYIRQSLHSFAGNQMTMVQVVTNYSVLDSRTESLVEAIRNTPPPATMHILVDGSTAAIIDYVNTLYNAFPIALLVVAVVTYLVLMLVFRSLILPLKAILMNLLSILASYGALVLIFQEGHLHQLLNFTPLGFVEASSPILMFCALFGLSMDYEVFLLSRIREAYERTGDNTRSVAEGLEQSGGIITSAAAIVILVSLSFASADMVLVKALGVGMAIAVFLDATLVRGLLVPATMRLLGNLNWWWPAPWSSLLPPVVYHHHSGSHGMKVPSDSHEGPRPASSVGGIRS
jgi:putative drug exporter of the RND superfamily